MDERWLPVPGYEGIYEVSDHGQVRGLGRLDSRGRRRAGVMRRPFSTRSGHQWLTLCKDGAEQRFSVHSLVLMAFVGPRPPKHEACHWDDDPKNNILGNLRWGTRAENMADCVRNGSHSSASKTHCPQGHEYTPENTYSYKAGSRACHECRRAYREEHREEQRVINREYMRQRRRTQEAMTNEKVT